MEQNEIERALRWQSLVNLGNQVKLKWHIDHHAVEQQLESLKITGVLIMLIKINITIVGVCL